MPLFKTYVDSTALIGLARIDRLDLLDILPQPICVTAQVWEEVTREPTKPGIAALSGAREQGLEEFARRFRERFDLAAPTILVTASHELRQRCARVQADGCIGKPFDLDAPAADSSAWRTPTRPGHRPSGAPRHRGVGARIGCRRVSPTDGSD